MKPLFIQYPKCTTCQKAAKWLSDNGVDYDDRNIVTQNPTAAELEQWIAKSDRGAAKFFNTSGLLYRSLELKDKVKVLSDQELVEILASQGMLVKRPVLVTDKGVLSGFKEEQWSAMLLGK